MRVALPIPISAAKNIAEKYNYHQVVIIARRHTDSSVEHVTTYGIDGVNCAVAARMGNFIKYKIMGWKPDEVHNG